VTLSLAASFQRAPWAEVRWDAGCESLGSSTHLLPNRVRPDMFASPLHASIGAAVDVRVACQGEMTVDNPVTARQRCHAADPRLAVLTLGRRWRRVRSRSLSEGRRLGPGKGSLSA
jgi:hypothetical protein